jgi:hypothetical protein
VPKNLDMPYDIHLKTPEVTETKPAASTAKSGGTTAETAKDVQDNMEKALKVENPVKEVKDEYANIELLSDSLFLPQAKTQ